jgi:hypothetical protein
VCKLRSAVCEDCIFVHSSVMSGYISRTKWWIWSRRCIQSYQNSCRFMLLHEAHTLCKVINESTLVFWDVTPCILVVRYKHFGQNCCICLKGTILYSSTLKEKHITLFQNVGTFCQTIPCHIIEDWHLDTTRRNSNFAYKCVCSGISLNIHQIIINNTY